MLVLKLPPIELYDSGKEEFITIPEFALTLEHSLVSISKWESRWNKPFISDVAKTAEETMDYIRCMTLSKNVPDNVYNRLRDPDVLIVRDYIDASMTATTIKQEKSYGVREVITSEIIYYWMITLNIPFECQKWHLNRLLTLINVCNIKSAPPKKINKKEAMDKRKALNAARKKSMATSG